MKRYKQILAGWTILGALFYACGGDGSLSTTTNLPPPPTGPKTLTWKPPQDFLDKTPLVPARDLQRYDIFVKNVPSFSPDDDAIAASPPGETTFNLDTLYPPLSKGVVYYVSIRAVATDDAKSDFSAVGSFSIPE